MFFDIGLRTGGLPSAWVFRLRTSYAAGPQGAIRHFALTGSRRAKSWFSPDRQHYLGAMHVIGFAVCERWYQEAEVWIDRLAGLVHAGFQLLCVRTVGE
jgi:hypothetical protein